MLWYNIGRGAAALALKFIFGMKLTFTGRENVPPSGGFILAANHASNLDPAVLAIACPRPVNFMAKEELFRNKFFGWLIASYGAFPVRRGAHDIAAVRTAFARVRKGGALLLFPQGGRKPLNDVSEPEPGVGLLSQHMQVPIVPAFVSGTDTALAPGSSRISKGARVSVRFGRPFRLEASRDYQRSAALIMDAIRRLADE